MAASASTAAVVCAGALPGRARWKGALRGVAGDRDVLRGFEELHVPLEHRTAVGGAGGR